MPPSRLPILRRLHHGLTLEGWADGIGVAAVVFTPYLVVALWWLDRVGWQGAFAVWVGGRSLAGPR